MEDLSENLLLIDNIPLPKKSSPPPKKNSLGKRKNSKSGYNTTEEDRLEITQKEAQEQYSDPSSTEGFIFLQIKSKNFKKKNFQMKKVDLQMNHPLLKKQNLILSHNEIKNKLVKKESIIY